MSGIPGSAGAAPIQNVGAYGQEIVETLVEVELLDEATGEVETVSADALGLGFRTSVLKQHYGRGAERSGVIVSITLELQDVGAGDVPVRGAQLRQALRLAPDAAVSLRWIRETVLATRAAKGMVLDDADPDTHSAGSFFQNAIVSASFARTLPPECPRWPMAVEIEPVTVIPLAAFDGVVPPPVSVQPDVKVSAAWLIEHSGLGKGFRLPRSRPDCRRSTRSPSRTAAERRPARSRNSRVTSSTVCSPSSVCCCSPNRCWRRASRARQPSCVSTSPWRRGPGAASAGSGRGTSRRNGTSGMSMRTQMIRAAGKTPSAHSTDASASVG
jgi:UDP-N-acetylenolpyruvoylglucosamine reductase